MPDVTIVIPCYNLARYLPQCLESICAQTSPDWECIIVNDGSTDETAAVARSFVRRDQRIRCINKRNQGLSSARNCGLDDAAGRYIQFLDADDSIAPTKFERQLVLLKAAAQPSLSYCDCERRCDESLSLGWTSFRMNPDLDVDEPLRDLAMRWENGLSIPSHCFLFDARLFSQHKIRFDQTLRNHEDWDCWMRIFATKPQVFHIPEVLATYRYRPDSLSANLRPMRKGFLAAVRKQRRILRGDPAMQAVLAATRRRVRSQYRDFAFPRSAYLRASRAAKGAMRRHLPDGMQQFLRTWRSRIRGLQHGAPERPEMPKEHRR
jgi:glycosyltransferase involved in cell wall biosynthesis